MGETDKDHQIAWRELTDRPKRVLGRAEDLVSAALDGCSHDEAAEALAVALVAVAGLGPARTMFGG